MRCACGFEQPYNFDQTEAPSCSRCNQKLPWVVVSDDTNIGKHLSVEKPFILDFYSDSCGPCRSIAPILDAIASEFAGKIRLIKAKVDTNRVAQKIYQAHSLPTLIIGKGGATLKNPHVVVGLQPKPVLVSLVASVVNS